MEAEQMAPVVTADIGPAPSSSSPLRLHDLQPDVLHNVLCFLGNQDLARLCQSSRRLAANALQACQHWAPKVEAWLLADPSRADLLQRLRLAGTLTEHNGPVQQPSPPGDAPGLDGVHLQQQQHQAAAEPTLQCQPARVRQDRQTRTAGCAGSQAKDAQGPATTPGSRRQPELTGRLNWRQVWTCIERAQQGPWQLDVQALTPAAAPNGVLLTFELLLQQPAPLVDASSSDQQLAGWRDSVTVISFVLDKKTVEIVVDAAGRVTSPQRDWCQGYIQLQPGQPRLLALEISYIMPVPAWFLHPCTLAAPRPSNSRGASSCCSSCASRMDQTWDSYSTGTSSDASSMSISNSIALCSAGAGDDCSIASTSMTSSSSIGNFTAVSSGTSSGCSCCGSDGRPRLSLDLSCGFGTYVSDPRYIDAAHQHLHRGLDRMELSSKVCWKPSKVQSWLGRLLPGIRGHSSSSSSSGGSSTSPRTSQTGSSSGNSLGSIAVSAPCSPSSGSRQGSKPSFAVSLSKVAAWQVPSDTDKRFAAGFLFWAVQHKLEQLLVRYGVLRSNGQPSSTCCSARSIGSAPEADSTTVASSNRPAVLAWG